MNREETVPSREHQAVVWFVRLHDCDDERQWLAHRDWLEADVANATMYANVERLWLDTDGLQWPLSPIDQLTIQPIRDEGYGTVIPITQPKTSLGRWRAVFWLPAAAAATLVAMVAGPPINGLFGHSDTTYQSEGNGHREIMLADGSFMTLDHDTEVTVRIDASERIVTLASGHAAFDVRHDAKRPFMIAAGDRNVRVLGTEFDVLVRDGAFGVAVRRGVVSVSGPEPSDRIVRLPAGKSLLNLPGAKGDEIGDVDPDNALAWRDGRLVYLDSDLKAVARDYERYVGKPVDVAPNVAELHISGVVKARDEDDLIRQLEQLLPVRIIKTKAGREIRKR